MGDIFLGIDTSCYTTSLCVCGADGGIIADIRKVLEVPDGQRGLRQSEMVFAHIKNLNAFFAENDIYKFGNIKAAAASCRPRPRENSYMPVFLVSETFAAAAASLCGARLYKTTHQQGHICAALIGSDFETSESYAAVHLSGGTAEILVIDGENTKIAGKTLDISAGQVIDRIGTMGGIKFPCGSEFEKRAETCGGDGLRFPVCVKGGDFNFSGLETKAAKAIESGESEAAVFKGIEAAVAKTVYKAVKNVCAENGIKRALFFGGVISNGYIRQKIGEELEKNGVLCAFAQKKYSSDNSAGLAVFARDSFFKTEGQML